MQQGSDKRQPGLAWRTNRQNELVDWADRLRRCVRQRAVVEPPYSKVCNRCPRVRLWRMLRLHFVQHYSIQPQYLTRVAWHERRGLRCRDRGNQG